MPAIALDPVAFFGTPAWAVPSLEALVSAGHRPRLVVTNPDRPAGRGYELRPPPVKASSLELDLPVVQPESVRDPAFAAVLAEAGIRVAVVVAYGKILPGTLLEVPDLGFVNLHFSLLPEYRGAAPVQRAVMDGKATTGVSVMVLTEGMDEGPVVATLEVDIGPDETAGELGSRLAAAGAGFLVRSLEGYASGDIEPVEQDHRAATYAPKITTEEARISWRRSAQAIKDQVRGLNPVPGAWTTIRDTRLKIHRVEVTGSADLPPGGVTFDGTNWLAGTGEGDVRIDEAQAHGKRRLPGVELARGMRLQSDDQLV